MSSSQATLVVGLATLNSPAFQESLQGAEVARMTALALFALAVFEYFITLNDEKEHFWTGPFTFSHVLFFLNRYLPFVVLALCATCFSLSKPKPSLCESMIQITFLITLIAIGIIEAILLVRVWYLLPSFGARLVKGVLIVTFFVTIVLSFVFLYLSANDLTIITILPQKGLLGLQGCKASRPVGFWRIYVPSLIMHTIIYISTLYQARIAVERWSSAEIRNRLLTDGGVFYFIVVFTVGFVTIGSILEGVPQLNIPAIYSPLVLAPTSIATTRMMFGLRRETAALGDSTSDWFVLSPLQRQDKNPDGSYLHM